MVAASGPALRQLAAPCPRTIGGSRSAFVVRFTQPVALRQQQQLRCCASEPRLPRVVGIGSKIIGCGSATPSLSVSNDDLSKILDTSDEWITARTGIRNRRILSGDETLGELSIQAAQRALEMAQVKAVDVDMLILCASTPDDLFGSSAQVSIGVGCTKAHGHDIRAGCCGFVDGLFAASSFIKGSNYHNILVVGADALSKFVDWTDRGTCILFGDAAGAVLVQACSAEEDGMLGFSAQNDGSGQKHLNARIINDESILSKSKGVPEFPFPPRKATYSCIEMNGKEVFRFAVRCVPPSIDEALEVAGLPVSSIDWLLLHQANQRIIDTVASRLDIPSEKVISNLADYGNTGAASIPLALDEAVRSGLVKAGDIIAVSGFGAGLKWGSAIVRWG